jgi:hypothetical protein
MLNGSADYHTFDHVKSKIQTKNYKWYYFLIAMLVFGLIGIAVYWNEISGVPGKIIINRSESKTIQKSNVQLQEKHDLSKNMMDMVNGFVETINSKAIHSETIVSTVIDQAEGAAETAMAYAQQAGSQAEQVAAEAEHWVTTALETAQEAITDVSNQLQNVIPPKRTKPKVLHHKN